MNDQNGAVALPVSIAEIFLPDDALFDLSATGKVSLVESLLTLLESNGRIASAEDLLQPVMDREAQGSTAFGRGIALPHARIEGLEKITMAIALAPEGVDFSSLDGKPTVMVCLLLIPSHESSLYNKVLAHINRLLRTSENRAALVSCQSGAELLQTFRELESEMAS